MRRIHDSLVLACATLLFLAAPARSYSLGDWIGELGRAGPGDESGYGESILAGVDFNGDDYPDLAVGAYLDGTGGEEAGRVYLYLSRSGKALVLPGSGDGARFGLALGHADLNGDGDPDLAVGAPGAEGLAVNTGAAYIFYGGALLDSEPDIFFPGREPASQFGYAVDGIGDFNHDGCEDLAIGAPFNESWRGRVDIYFGGPEVDNESDLCFNGPLKCGRVGYSVAATGDVNGDGAADFLAGAPTKRIWDSSDDWPDGRTYLFFGGADPDSIPDRIFKAIDYKRLFGFDLAGPGDIDGDGFNDVAIGAPRKKSYPPKASNGWDPGHVWVYLGSAEIDTTADLKLMGESPDDAFGTSLVFCDANNDGFSDLIIGAPENDDAGESAGAIYLYAGGTELPEEPAWSCDGDSAGDRFGFSCSGTGSLNGDLVDDFGAGVVGAGRIRLYGYISKGRPGDGIDLDVITGGIETEFDLEIFCSQDTSVHAGIFHTVRDSGGALLVESPLKDLILAPGADTISSSIPPVPVLPGLDGTTVHVESFLIIPPGSGAVVSGTVSECQYHALERQGSHEPG